MKKNTGWECTKCGASNAPSVKQCPCSSNASTAKRLGKPRFPFSDDPPVAPRIEMPTPTDPPGAPPRITGLGEVVIHHHTYHGSPRML